MDECQELAQAISGLIGALLPRLGELDRREGFRREGATSLVTWMTQRLGVSEATARSWGCVAGRTWDLPLLTEALHAGELTFDKVHAVVEYAQPETEGEVVQQAKECSVRQLRELARRARQARATDDDTTADHATRWLRFCDSRRTISMKLPVEKYNQVRSEIEAEAKKIPSDGITRWDQRLCDAFIRLIGCNGPSSGDGGPPNASRRPLVVAHIDYALLRGGESDLLAELQDFGLISHATARRIACDADIAIGLDDGQGHTMYEGRKRRYPSDAQRREIWRRDRTCRFGSCPHSTFTEVHHLVPWDPVGPTDLDNLVLLCDHHHDRIHTVGWHWKGNPNTELTFIAPNGTAIVSRPSPMWTTRRDRAPTS